MAIETTYDREQTAALSGNVTATAEDVMDKGTEAYAKAEQAAGEAYDKTAHQVSETYERAKSYSGENPGKTILIALGVGVGIGLLLSASFPSALIYRAGSPTSHQRDV
jgi:ElaB/YqjD/DUF883 family membrane-anchored ribosome-binding protein